MKWLLRLWGVRHVRAIYLDIVVWHWAEQWHRAGIGTGCPNVADLEYIDMVWRGEA
jgi:hypothetical protein